jgi:hypothetical protein
MGAISMFGIGVGTGVVPLPEFTFWTTIGPGTHASLALYPRTVNWSDRIVTLHPAAYEGESGGAGTTTNTRSNERSPPVGSSLDVN